MSSWRFERARELIDESGYTHKHIARKVGIEPNTLSHLLSGRRNPGLPLLILLAHVLETTPDELWPEKSQEANLPKLKRDRVTA